jgi:ferritin heavy chain
MSSTNAIRQNFSADAEAALNKQINMELTASYTYQSMAFYFDRHDVALPGFSKFFKHNSEEEREHAEKFMSYLNKRGGRVTYGDVKAPQTEWGTGLDALNAALQLERDVNESLLNLHAVATANNDPHLSDFLESEFLDEQVEAIKKLGDLITRLKRAGPTGLGEYLFDKDLSS